MSKESLDSGLGIESSFPFGDQAAKFFRRVEEIKQFFRDRGEPDDSLLEEKAGRLALKEERQRDNLNDEKSPH